MRISAFGKYGEHERSVKACPNGKCLVTKYHLTLFGDQTFYVWPPCLVLFDHVWSCLIKFEGHCIFDQTIKKIFFCSCLMGHVLLVWTAADQTCFASHICSAACIHSLICV